MGLLDQLFRHKSAIPEDRAAQKSSASGEGVTGDGVQVEPQVGPPGSKGLGAIASAIGTQPDRGMPEMFEVSLGDLLRRVPETCVWPGRHDPGRVVRVPSAEICDGISKGRAELPLARLISLAPDIFRWEPGD